MAKEYPNLNEQLVDFIERQKTFFSASASEIFKDDAASDF